MSSPTISRLSPPGSYLTQEQVFEVIAQACPTSEFHVKKVLLIVPDATRTCPLGMLFKGIFDQIGAGAAALDVKGEVQVHETRQPR